MVSVGEVRKGVRGMESLIKEIYDKVDALIELSKKDSRTPNEAILLLKCCLPMDDIGQAIKKTAQDRITATALDSEFEKFFVEKKYE